MINYDRGRRIFIVNLKAANNDKPFVYDGYRSLAQIGQYYSVSIPGKDMRLYTTVNFVQSHNVQMMEEISRHQTFVRLNYRELKSHSKTYQTTTAATRTVATN